MNTIIRVLVMALTVVFTTVNAQDFQGIATYKSHRKVDLKMDNEKMSNEMQEQLAAQLREQFQQTYTLKFTKNESFYKKEEKLSKPNPMANKGGITITVSESTDILYKNLRERRYTMETEIYGKAFLIKDSIEDKKWELSNETKNIGEYTCYKAVYKDSINTTTFSDDGKIEKVKKERQTIVWYTPQIPVSNGPSDFGGLPGLILEVNEGDLTLICSKIVINPEESFEINEPDKGKVVSQLKFDEIMEKKEKEMMERFRPRRGSKKGERTMITIGG